MYQFPCRAELREFVYFKGEIHTQVHTQARKNRRTTKREKFGFPRIFHCHIELCEVHDYNMAEQRKTQTIN